MVALLIVYMALATLAMFTPDAKMVHVKGRGSAKAPLRCGRRSPQGLCSLRGGCRTCEEGVPVLGVMIIMTKAYGCALLIVTKSRQHKLENKAKQKQNGHWRTPTVLVDLNTQQIQEQTNKQPTHENIPFGSSACSTHDSNPAQKKKHRRKNIARNAVGKSRTKQTDSKTTSNVV